MSYRRHITRLVTIIGLVVAGFIVVRSLLVPDSFGEYGHFRGANLEEQMDLKPLYQGTDKCKECHQEQYGDWQESGHMTVVCEVCHGHWEIHNGNLKTMTAVSASDACLICHLKLAGRPDNFPQIGSFAQHLKDQDVSEEDVEGCVDCHDPHVPL